MLSAYDAWKLHDGTKIDYRKPIGLCEHCGEAVYSAEDVDYEDETPYLIERSYFHDRCIMPYARQRWKID